jgi:hypothetical protein
MTATSARNARSTSVAAVSPGTEKAIQCARKAIINMAACDEIKLKLAGEGYGAYPKIINRNKADITLEQLKGAMRCIKALEAPMDILALPNFIHLESVSLGGPPPGFLQKGHFLCGTSTEKALRKGPNIQWTTARPRLRIGNEPSHRCHDGLHLAHKLHPLQRGNWYMSQQYGMTHTNVHAVLLAEFGFAQIPPRNK